VHKQYLVTTSVAVHLAIMPEFSRFSDEEIKRMKRLDFNKVYKVIVLLSKLLIATDNQAIDCARQATYKDVLRGRAQISVNSDFLQKISKSSFRQPDEMLTEKWLMRIKVATFITGQPLSAHMCKQLVHNIYDNHMRTRRGLGKL